MFRQVLIVLMVLTAALAFKTDRTVEFEKENLPIHESPIEEEEESDFDDMENEIMPHNHTENEVGPVEDLYVDEDNIDAKMARCPRGFLRYGRVCLYFGINYVSWFDALTICKFVAKGAHLAEIRCKYLQRAAMHGMRRRKAKGEYWVGGVNLFSRKFRWNFSSAHVAKSLWARNEPNNANNAEHCTELRHNGLLNDNDCQARRLYICIKY